MGVRERPAARSSGAGGRGASGTVGLPALVTPPAASPR